MDDETRSIFAESYQQIESEDVNFRLSHLLFLMMISPQYTVQQ